MRQKTKGASIPSKRFEGSPPSNPPLPVGRPPNPAFEPLHVNHFIASAARPKETVGRPKPFDIQAMNSTADSILHPKTSPPTGLPSGKKTKATKYDSAASAAPFTPMPSTVTLGDGRVIQIAAKPGKNDPSKKPPPPERRPYKPVGDWREGCPICPARPSTYDSFITHRGRCPNKPKPQK
jgi:hypothetical protein